MLELLQESQIVLDEMPYVVDAVLSHGNALDAEAKGPAGVNFRINFARGEDVRMNHSAAAQLDPPLFVLEPDINLRAGFGEREKAGAEADFGGAAEIGADELHDGAFEINHGHVLVDDEGFELVEHEKVRGVDGVGSIDAAGDDDADGGFLFFHHADLDGAGLGAKKNLRFAILDLRLIVRGQVKVIERITRGMLFGDVEGDEVVEFILDFRAGGGGEAHPSK